MTNDTTTHDSATDDSNSDDGNPRDSTAQDTTAQDTTAPTFDPLKRGKPLYRTTGHLGGVAGGLGEYLDVDPTLIRIGVAVLTLSTGPAAVAAYIAAWLMVPDATGSTMVGDDAAPAHHAYA